MGVPPAVNTSTEGRAFRERYGLHTRRLLTLFGYVTPNKGYEMVAQVLPTLPADVMFVIAGGARRPIEEAYVQHLKLHLRNQGVDQRVVITGYLVDDDLADAMQASDIALAPHTQATNSYSVMLAVSHGRPTHGRVGIWPASVKWRSAATAWSCSGGETPTISAAKSWDCWTIPSGGVVVRQCAAVCGPFRLREVGR